MSNPPPLLSLTALIICVVLLFVVAIAAEPPVDAAPAIEPEAVPPPHRVVLRSHQTPRVLTGANDADGNPATISCSTCHSMLAPHAGNGRASDLDLFHQGMHFQHGPNSCLSCHNPDDYDSLHLANGTSVPFTDSIQLCSQCHGTQRRDYDRGVHGGMNGYWDLSRGGRIRNTCVNCHDAHVPKYQGAIPAPGPRDRFQQHAEEHVGAAHE